ncbi:hypothetical protein Cantr_01821 [Candida viswanathii]|uniref:RRM domain-containing protein n=1 Tax=Candida viswanathii TaxID=5486 RepID=A0A367YLR5_9ASCO|nr:hypothetical protein Cantr_01821 [Candida viswanathii]
MGPKVNSNILYLGNIPFDWDQETVGSVVYGSGDIVDIRLGFDHVGKNKGFCFVEYRTVQDAARAMPLLQQVSYHVNNRTKYLKVESSKESFHANRIPPETRPVLPLDRSKMPHYVQVPNQMLINGPGSSSAQPGYPQQQQQQQQQQQFQQPFQRSYPGFQQTPPPPPSQVLMPPQPVSMGLGPNQQMPPKLLNAVQNLPPSREFSLETPDKINENLSKLGPPELIQMIANLKNLVQTDPMKVQEFILQNPVFGTSIAQALLLMGFVDNQVITESQKSSSSTPQSQFAQPSYQNQQYQGVANNNPYGNNGPQFQQQQQQQQQAPPLQLTQQQKVLLMQNPEVLSFPPEIQQKLLNYPSDQIKAAVHVLKTTPEEMLRMQPDQRHQFEMVKRTFNV